MTKTKQKAPASSRKKKDITMLVMLLAILLLVNFVCSFYFKRFDLTSEKRYTLSPSTINMLKKLDDVVYLKVYLQGDINPSFARLKNETREILDEFRAYSNGLIEYEFVNLSDNPNKDEVGKIEQQLYDKGIVPEQVVEKTKEKTSQVLLWPGAIVSHKGKEGVWQIFKRQVGIPPEQCINNSVQELEYSLTNSIRKLQLIKKPEVVFLEGHGELDTIQTADLMKSLSEYYTVYRSPLNHNLKALQGTDAIVIAQPDSAFDEKDKFIIDQFIMRGGKALWLIDPVYTNMDTFRLKGFTLGFKNELNLEDMLFKYGCRLNPVLVQDLQCATIPINVGFKKGQPNFQMFPWLYNPLVLPSINHPIVKNLDLIKFEFAGTIDTVTAYDVKKTILLQTSKYTKTQPTPARVALAMVNFQPKEDQFRNSYQNVACLLEGKFESVYKNRLTRTIMNDSAIAFQDKSKPTKMIVVSDGDIAKNDYQRTTGMIYPLGYDIYMKQTFANKTFLLNCMNYLLDDEGLLQLRSREVKLRLLDKKKINLQGNQWKMINLAYPLGIIVLLGLTQFYIRKKRYSEKK